MQINALSVSGDGDHDQDYDDDGSAEVVLPTYMDPPSDIAPKCERWLKILFASGELPEKRHWIQTTFHLLTRLSSIKFLIIEQVVLFNCIVRPSRYNPTTKIKINPSKKFPKKARKLLTKIRKTVIIIHGFRSNAEEGWMNRMAEAFLNKVCTYNN